MASVLERETTNHKHETGSPKPAPAVDWVMVGVRKASCVTNDPLGNRPIGCARSWGHGQIAASLHDLTALVQRFQGPVYCGPPDSIALPNCLDHTRSGEVTALV